MKNIRIEKTAKLVMESGGKKSVSKAMKEAGYPNTTAKNPQKITRSKTWQELMDQYIPEKLIAKKHKELLNAKKKIRYYKKGDLEREEEYIDNEAIRAGIDMGYKLRGRYKPTVVHIQNFTGWTPEELEAYAATGIIPKRFTDESESEI